MAEKGSIFRLRYGMVGGGPGSFIGPVHKASIDLDHSADLVCGCFSRDAEKNRQAGNRWGLDDARVYDNFFDMAEKEAAREDGIDFVVIVVPNSMHYAASKAFLEKGINVVCDKPLAFTVEQGYELMTLAVEKGLEFMVTYTYTGYPMVQEARRLVRSGELGVIRMVMAEYPQDWLSDKAEETDNKQAQWRVDPTQAGLSCCVGDIGTHVENMVHYVTGLEIESLSANLDTFVEGRLLDDNARICLDYKGGAKGIYWSSQIAIGNENGLKIRIYGTKGGIEWAQERPNTLYLALKGKPVQIMNRGNGYVCGAAQAYSRIPAGHPEGYFEAFGNLYRNYCEVLKAGKAEIKPDERHIFTDVVDGVRGIKFVADCVKSSNEGGIRVDGSFNYE
ncbi:MAG TPA: Gfo/Idh/MocA family oxidoreductase [Thermotogota bacterium]|nr:Gfo/Idh/MocA family oxidoreductase [Thermotogota bacterium]